ncbi:MAG: lipocalin-like domain-containing protein [Chthoniobacterales bacterium]
MRRVLYFCIVAFTNLATAGEWRIAQPGWVYEFPREHHSHRDFKTEWWYLTGNVFDAEGNHLGYELTFFRQGIRPPADHSPNASRFIVDDLKFAHFAVTDVTKQQFHYEQKTSRGAFGEAGFDDGKRLAWIDNWTLSLNGDDAFDLVADMGGKTMHLHLHAKKPPAVHGENGVSLKATGEGHASHYYSMSRLETTGEFFAHGNNQPLRGESWFDHEWATNQLGAGEVGWNWLCVQWNDGTELMLYQMRREDGSVDPSSSGSWVAADGGVTHLYAADFMMTPTRWWKSDASGARYPIAWRVNIPSRAINFDIAAVVDKQELALGPITYWEGAIDAHGTRDGTPLKGHGYLELTGYASPLRELNR